MNDTKYLLEQCNDLYGMFISNLRVQDNHRMKMRLLEAIYITLLIHLHDILKSLKGVLWKKGSADIFGVKYHLYC